MMYLSKSFVLLSHLKQLHCKSSSSLICPLSTLSLVDNLLQKESVSAIDLINTFNFCKGQSAIVEKRLSATRSPCKPLAVLKFFRKCGFSDSHILLTVRRYPIIILYADIEKTIKPKIEFFQTLGFLGSDLGKFISRNPSLLTVSLEKKLIPYIEFLKKNFGADKGKEDLSALFRKCGWKLTRCTSQMGNIAFLESSGIVGSQLLALRNKDPALLCASESVLRRLVERATNMGFPMKSRMLVYALSALHSMTDETFRRKQEFLCSFGFSKAEIMQIFINSPHTLNCSEDKLKISLQFYLHEVKVEKSALVRAPYYLHFSMEERLLPRYRVLKMIKSKKLMRKDPSIMSMFLAPEDKFLQKFILRFKENSAELLVIYKDILLGALKIVYTSLISVSELLVFSVAFLESSGIVDSRFSATEKKPELFDSIRIVL